MTEAHDYSDSIEELGDNILAQISATADQMREMLATIADLETQLKVAQAEYMVLATKTMPELMDSAGQESVKTSSGLKVNIKTTVRANIPKEHHTAAIKWLRENGFGALVKNQVIAEFGMGQDDAAIKLADNLKNAGVGSIKTNEGVNHMTLTSWAKDKLENDPNLKLPLDLLGVFRQRVAEVK